MSKRLSPPISKTLEKLLTNTLDLALKRRARRIIEEINPQPGDRILEIGCGDGYYLHLLSSLQVKNLKLTGIDIDAKALVSARKNLKDRKIRLLEVDIMKGLPFKDNSFDKIIMSEVCEHLPDDIKGLKKIKRVLKKGGTLIVTVPNYNFPFLWDPINWVLQNGFGRHITSGFWAGIWNQHERLYKPKEIAKVAHKAGFKHKLIEPITTWSLPFNHYIINLGAIYLAKNKTTVTAVTRGANKFKQEHGLGIFPLTYLSIASAIDKLNDRFPLNFSVSILLVLENG